MSFSLDNDPEEEPVDVWAVLIEMAWLFAILVFGTVMFWLVTAL